MFETVKEDINKEAEGKNAAIRVIADALISRAEKSHEICEIIHDALTAGKTLQGAYKEMESVARKKAVGGCAVLTDEEGLKIVYDYFGIREDQKEAGGKVVSIFDLM